MAVTTPWKERMRWQECFVVILLCNVLAKSGAMWPGYNTDDYAFLSGIDQSGGILAQGRLLQVVIHKALEATNTNMVDLAPLTGPLCLLAQSLSVFLMLRFCKVRQPWVAAVVGSVMVTHPFATEILTFRMALPAYAVTMLLLSSTLWFVNGLPNRTGRWLAVLSCTLGLLTYQIILNYVLLMIFLSAMARLLEPASRDPRSTDRSVDLWRNSYTLMGVALVSVCLFYAISGAFNRYSGIALTTRGKFICSADVLPRLRVLYSSGWSIFWQGESAFPAWAKQLSVGLYALATAGSVACAGYCVDRGLRPWRALLALAGAICLVPCSFGVIVVLGDWWPTYRVISQLSALFVLVALAMQSLPLFGRSKSRMEAVFLGTFALLLIQYAATDTQIFADQRRVNSWDHMHANRIVSRLEANKAFAQATTLYVGGGLWRHPRLLRASQMDINLSALGVRWANVQAINAATGYEFHEASAVQVEQGAAYCKQAALWPDQAATSIQDELAIVCLARP